VERQDQPVTSIPLLPPQPFKPRRIRRGVLYGVLNIPVSKVILNEPRISALVSQGEAARMAQHVGMGDNL
jgi:hypothetical protein